MNELREELANTDFNWSSFRPEFGRSRWWNAPYPTTVFDRLVTRKGNSALDIGTGAGVVACELAKRGMKVVGIDSDERMLERATAHEGVTYRRMKAEEIDKIRRKFSLVTAAQCWHWFDGRTVARKAINILIPSGKVSIFHFDWVDSPRTVVKISEEIIESHNPRWRSTRNYGIYAKALDDLTQAGFTNVHSRSTDHVVLYTVEEWVSRVLCSTPINELPDYSRDKFEHELRSALRLAPSRLEIVHRLFEVTGSK